MRCLSRHLCKIPYGGSPKIRNTFLGVPKIRIIVFRGLYCGPPVLGNYHMIPHTSASRPCRPLKLSPRMETPDQLMSYEDALFPPFGFGDEGLSIRSLYWSRFWRARHCQLNFGENPLSWRKGGSHEQNKTF